MGVTATKRLFSKSIDEEERLGEFMVEELDRMKGLAMKVGQIFSYMDVGLPQGTVTKLTALQSGVEPLDPCIVVPLIEEALGAPIGELFERFDTQAVAAASIGQVHRAQLAGQEVAVKVRYPGVQETIASDLKRLEPLAKLAAMASHVDGLALVTELSERMQLECDYGQEAGWQQTFSALFADDPDIIVPAVLPERCASTVLTTAWCPGHTFEDLRARPHSERVQAAQTLARFPYQSVLAHGILQADPHPGNFLFEEGARVVALDYGCVRPFSVEMVGCFRGLSSVVVHTRRSEFRDAVVRAGLAPRPDKLDWDGMWEMMRWMYAPYLHPSFEFRRQWWEAGLHYSRPSNRNLRHQGLPPEWLWLQRMQFGLHAVLLRLNVDVPLRDLFIEALERPLEKVNGAGI